MPGLDRYVTPEAEQFANVASSALTLEQWLRARAAHQRALSRRTRTSPASSSRAAPTRSRRWRTSSTSRSATARPGRRRRLDAQPEHARLRGRGEPARGRSAWRPSRRRADKGVLVVLNDEINAAREVTKTDALRLQTFQSRGVRAARRRRPRSRRLLPRRREAATTATSEFDLSSDRRRCRAWTCSWSTRARSGDLIKAAVDQGAKGIVIAVGRRRRDERHAGRGHRRTPSRRASSSSRARAPAAAASRAAARPPRARADEARRAAPPVAPGRGRGPRAGQGAHPADARADEDEGRRGDSADVPRVLTGL